MRRLQAGAILRAESADAGCGGGSHLPHAADRSGADLGWRGQGRDAARRETDKPAEIGDFVAA